MIYAARYETMNGLLSFFTDNCCRGTPSSHGPSDKRVKGVLKKERVS
jgi:hypothetical protein